MSKRCIVLKKDTRALNRNLQEFSIQTYIHFQHAKEKAEIHQGTCCCFEWENWYVCMCKEVLWVLDPIQMR